MVGKKMGSFVVLCLCLVVASCGRKPPVRRVPVTVTKSQVDLQPLLKELKDEDYGAAYQRLDERLRAAWSAEAFAKDVAQIRRAIGNDAWAPKSIGFMNSNSPKGPVCSCSFRLTKHWESRHILEIVSLDSGKGFRIVQWSMSAPVDSDDEGLKRAQVAASGFLSALRDEQYDKALNIMTSQCRVQVSKSMLTRVRGLFWPPGEKDVAFTKASTRKLVDGKWYYSVVAFPKGKEMNFLEVMLDTGGPRPEVASLKFKAKISD